MVKDNSKKIYMILGTNDDDVRKVRTFDEMFGVLSVRGQDFKEYVSTTTEEGLETFVNIRRDVLGEGGAPVRIIEEDQLIYYVSPDEKRGVIFTDEKDAQELFLNVEETFKNVVGAKKR